MDPGGKRTQPLLARARSRSVVPVENASPILAGLNDAQSCAVTAPDKVLQILAPPGSGKTRTLTSRVAYLLSDAHGLDPRNVIVATFTVKAANEMKQRLSAMVGEGVESRLLLGTFHSIALRYLKKYGHLIGLRPRWTIADSSDTLGICSRILKRRRIPLDASTIRSRISHFKARNMTPLADDFAKPPPSTIPLSPRSQKKNKNISSAEFVDVYEDYQTALELQNQLDFDDLLICCLELLRQFPECVSNIEAVLIDEYQDTNIVQFDLMRKFASKRGCITIVGDPDQSIYGFRAAEIGNLKRMRAAYKETRVINLEENYRSSASILQLALEVIQQDDARPEKPLMPTHAVGTRPVLRRTLSSAAEAQWIATEIKRICAVTAGIINLKSIAILVRSASLTRSIENELVKAGIGYKMVGGRKFFDRPEVKIVLDYLRVIQNPANNEALGRIINIPSRRIGDATVKALLDEAEEKGISLWDVVRKSVQGDMKWPKDVSKPAEKGLGQLTGLVMRAVDMLDGGSAVLAEIVEALLKKAGYDTYLRTQYPNDFDSRLANVSELISQAREVNIDEDEEALPEIEGVQQQKEACTDARTALERFLANVALVSEKTQENAAEHVGEVTISTIHAAKGLEWPAVFIPAVYEGSIPHSRAEDVNEERRLLYVAMTRAQALLYMSCPLKNSPSEKTTLSQFLDDKKITRLLAPRAPQMYFSNVQTLCHILTLPCPTDIELRQAIERADIPSEQDDQIPEEEAIAEESSDENDKNADPEYRRERKRRRLLAQQASSLGLEGNSTTWKGYVTLEDQIKAKRTTVEQLGFRSAGMHFSELQKQGAAICEAEGAVKRRMGLHEKTKFGAAITKVRKKSAASTLPAVNTGTGSQPAITGFFKKKEPPPQCPNPKRKKTASDIVKAFQHSEVALSEQLSALPAPVIPTRAAGDFILLSSSPPRPVNLKAPEQESNTVVGLQHRAEDDNPAPLSSPMFEAFCQMADEGETPLPPLPDENAGRADMKTITRTQSILNTVGNVHRGAGKRTLGIRRSMNGWQNRGRGR